MQHDETVLPEMLRLLQSMKFDVVIGSRRTAGGSMGEFAQGARSLKRPWLSSQRTWSPTAM